MSCKHPLKAFPVGRHPSGKIKYLICSYSIHHVEDRGKELFVPCHTEYVSPYARKAIKNFVEIPCGKCIDCRLKYSRQWADRCMLELQYHESSYFVTLTYDDDHLPINDYIDPVTGEIGQSATLVKKDMQDFFKRLRDRYSRRYDNKLRYYFCGEYGSQTMRPHYHAIIFGLKLDDLVPYKRTSQGFLLYNSEFLDKCWQHRGYVVVANVTWDTCAYTARYILKKQYGSAAEIYERFNFLPEFTQMSLRPAIGRQYYEDHKDEIYSFDTIHIPTSTGGLRIRPPRYYDKLFDVDYPDKSALLKEQRRKFAEESTKYKLDRTSNDYLEMLAVEERNLIARIDKGLPRKEI